MGLLIFYKKHWMSGEQEKRLVNREVEASDLRAFRLGSVPCFTRKDLSQPELFSLFCMKKKKKKTWLPSLYYRERWANHGSLSSGGKNKPTTASFLVLYRKNKSKSAIFSILCGKINKLQFSSLVYHKNIIERMTRLLVMRKSSWEKKVTSFLSPSVKKNSKPIQFYPWRKVLAKTANHISHKGKNLNIKEKTNYCNVAYFPY